MSLPLSTYFLLPIICGSFIAVVPFTPFNAALSSSVLTWGHDPSSRSSYPACSCEVPRDVRRPWSRPVWTPLVRGRSTWCIADCSPCGAAAAAGTATGKWRSRRGGGTWPADWQDGGRRWHSATVSHLTSRDHSPSLPPQDSCTCPANSTDQMT